MVQFRYVYWCISHLQYVAPKARRKLRDQLRCKIVKLNLIHLGQVDFLMLSTWMGSLSTTKDPDIASRQTGTRLIPRRVFSSQVPEAYLIATSQAFQLCG